MKRCLALSLSVVFACAVLASCASIIKGSREEITIKSAPVSNAKVTIINTKKDNKVVATGETPFKTSLKTGDAWFRAAEYKIIVEAPGFEKREIDLPTEVRLGWYGFGNACIGGLIGWFIIDPLTGSMYTFDLEDKTVMAELAKSMTYFDPRANELTIVLLEEVPEHLRPELIEVR